MRRHKRQCLRLIVVLLVVVLWDPVPGLAEHESTNTLEFAPMDTSLATDARGDGTIDFRGGDASESRWTASFQFSGLTSSTAYVVVVKGRFGEDGAAEASQFTEMCSFWTDDQGSGGCWYYFVVLKRLGTVQVRQNDVDGPVVLQATRADGPGSITSHENEHSPPETVPASPEASAVASPVATPT